MASESGSDELCLHQQQYLQQHLRKGLAEESFEVELMTLCLTCATMTIYDEKDSCDKIKPRLPMFLVHLSTR